MLGTRGCCCYGAATALIIALCFLFSTSSFGGIDLTAVEPSNCNLSAYRLWYEEIYEDELLSEDGFWPLNNVPLTRGKAMELASEHCQSYEQIREANTNVVLLRRLKQLLLDFAGGHGPVKDKYIYDVMCSVDCLSSDSLRTEAIAISRCDCMSLSTQPEEAHFSKEGDFCLQNTGRMLCEQFGYCGTWECALGGFMCPRYEYNNFEVPHRGYGSCRNPDN